MNAEAWKYYALLSAFFAALTALFSKLGTRGINTDLAVAIRASFILCLLWGIVFVTNALNDLKSVGVRDMAWLLASALATGLSWLFYFRALRDGDASKVAPLDKLSVPITILLSILLLGEEAGWKTLLGGAMITVGSLILLL